MAAASHLPCLSLQQASMIDRNNGLRATRPCIASYTPPTFPGAREGLAKLPQVIVKKAKRPRFQVLVQKVVSSGPKEIVMVDPIEAKRLAAEQMKQLQAKAEFKRQRTIEAINGGWAMLGLTVGIVIEGYTGKTILSQVAGYLHVLADTLDKYLPSSLW